VPNRFERSTSMHEFSIAQSVIETVRAQLPADERRPIRSVTLKLGQFNRIAPESLEYYFEIVREGTVAREAKLKIIPVPIQCRCGTCGFNFEGGRYVTICDRCGKGGVELISGNELNVIEIELSK